MSGNVFVSPYNPVQQQGCRAKNPPDLVIASRAPLSSDYAYFIGTIWLYIGNGYYALLSQSISPTSKSGTWVALGTIDGGIDTLSDDSNTEVTPDAGNIKLAGTSDQIATTAGSSVITFSIPDTFVAPGSIASTTSLTVGNGLTVTEGGATVTAGNIVATAGNISTSAGSITSATSLTASSGAITATNGNLVLAGAGNKLLIHATTSTSDSIGTATLSSGTVTVPTTAVTSSSKVFLSYASCASDLACSLDYTIDAGVHIVITSQDLTDSSSTVNYLIIN